MLNQQLIERRLERMRGYYDDVCEALSARETFPRQLFFHYALERLIQLIVDEMIDVNNHIISCFNLSVPDDFQSTFRVLSDKNFLSHDLAERLAPIVGLRNRLVHRYETVDRTLMLEVIAKEKDDIRDYISAVAKMIHEKR